MPINTFVVDRLKRSAEQFGLKAIEDWRSPHGGEIHFVSTETAQPCFTLRAVFHAGHLAAEIVKPNGAPAGNSFSDRRAAPRSRFPMVEFGKGAGLAPLLNAISHEASLHGHIDPTSRLKNALLDLIDKSGPQATADKLSALLASMGGLKNTVLESLEHSAALKA